MAKVTMADVARETQVNKATVSRALKGDPRISLATREKVWEAAKKLGYRVDTVARGLSSRRTDVVGVVLRDLGESWVGSFLSGVERVLARHRMEMLVKEANDLDASSRSAYQRLLDRKVDGVIWASDAPFPSGEDGIPSVIVGNGEGDPSMRVLLDEEVISRNVLSFAGGRPISYRGGDRPFFPFLEGLSSIGREDGMVLWDGDLPSLDNLAEGILLCGDRSILAPLMVPHLPWPAFDMGHLSARGLINVVREKGVRPKEIKVSSGIVGVERSDLGD